MEVFVSPTSVVFILGPDGLRYPNYDEGEYDPKKKQKAIVDFGTATQHQPISKCKCKSDEIIIEKTRFETLKITTGHSADPALYPKILALAVQGDFKIEIHKCENMRDMYELDKAVQNYMENYK